MGQGSSTSVFSGFNKHISGTELTVASKEIREMSDALFKFMYSKWSEKDAMDIAIHPENYVIALSTFIENNFNAIGYKTRMGKHGEIYFMKYDLLEPPYHSEAEVMSKFAKEKSEIERGNALTKRRRLRQLTKITTRRKEKVKQYEKHKKNAQIIAFYFTRIFQILGALLLVVKDINIPEYDKKTFREFKSDEPRANSEDRTFIRRRTEETSLPFKSQGNDQGKIKNLEEEVKRLRAEQYNTESLRNNDPRPVIGGGRTNGSKIMYGGGLGNFSFLDLYFEPITNEIKENFRRYNIRLGALDNNQDIFFLKDKTGDQGFFLINILSNSMDLYFPVKQGDSYIFTNSIKLKIDSNLDNNYPKYIRLINERNFALSINKTSEFCSKNCQYYISDIQNLRAQQEYPFRKKLSSLSSEGFPKQLVELTKYNLILGTHELFRPGDIQGVNDEEGDQPAEPIDTSLIPFSKDEYKKQSEIAKLLNKKKNLHQPHCIARALQLLDSVSINEELTKKDAVSRICKPLPKTPYPVTSSIINSTKNPGASITAATSLADYYPTRALGQLFGNVNPVNYEESFKVLKAFVKINATEPSRDPLNPENITEPSESKALSLAIEKLSKAFNNVLEKDKPLPKKLSEIRLPHI